MNIFGYEISKPGKEVYVEKAAQSSIKQKAVGFVGLKASGGRISEEFLTDLQWTNAGKVYQEMASNDAVIGGCLYLMETLIRRANWHCIVPDPGTDKEVNSMEEWRLFIEQCMNDMDQSWDSFISEVLSMLPYGFSFHEIAYKVRRGPLEKDKKFKSKYSDGKIGWRGMPIRSQATLQEWVFDDTTGEALAFRQDISLTAVKGGAGTIDIPLEGNLLFRTKESRGNPEGQSVLRRAYRSWYFKKYMEELEGIGVERNLAGIPVLKPDESTPLFDDTRDDMKQLLNWATELVAGIRKDTTHGVVLPHGWELNLIGSEGNDNINTDTIIHRHESRMAITMLADIVLLGGDRTGSFALADTKKSILIRSLEAVMNSICAVLNNTAIPTLLIMNGVTDFTNMPQITADAIEEPSLSDLALILRSINIDVTKNKELFNFIMRIASAPELSEADLAVLEKLTQDTGGSDDPDNPLDNSKPKDRFQDETDNQLK